MLRILLVGYRSTNVGILHRRTTHQLTQDSTCGLFHHHRDRTSGSNTSHVDIGPPTSGSYIRRATHELAEDITCWIAPWPSRLCIRVAQFSLVGCWGCGGRGGRGGRTARGCWKSLSSIETVTRAHLCVKAAGTVSLYLP